MAADKSLCQVPSFQHALLAISRLLYQLVKRFEFAKFDLENIIHRLSGQRDACIPASDVDYAENFLGSVLEKEIGRLVSIVSHAHTTVIEPEDDLHEYQPPGNGPNIPHLISVYDPPGDLSKYGQRHDNDNMEISSINILPTLEELKCIREPFLPSNCIPQAPHFLPHGWKRQMDIQFRLFREDLMNPLKNGLMSFLDALSKTSKGKEEELLRQKVFKGNNEGINANANVNVDVYGDVQFHKVECDIHGKDFATVTFAQPYQNRNSLLGRRRAFWEQSKGRLMQGGLVLMVRRSNNRDAESSSVPDIVLGVVAEREPRKLAMDEEHASILISLMDPKLYFAMIDATNPRENRQWFLVEPSGAFFESYRPVLEVLQTRLPSTMPFGKYMAPTNEEAEAMLPEVKIDPPMYARAPGFRFDLSVLMNGQELKLDVTNPESPAMVLDALQRCKTLDDTQARALVNTLCREVSLINGPPGTGKTRIGVELMRVLLHNMRSMNSGPILCICYTNHALDQFLEHLLDKKITNIVRVGSQSKSTRLEDYNLQAFVDGYKKPRRLKKAMTALNEQWRTLCKRIDELQEDLQRDDLSWKQVEEYLRINHPGLWEQFVEKPLFDLGATDGFTEVRRGRKKSLFHQWVEGDDINELKRWNQEVQEVMDTKWHAQSRNSFGFLDDKYAKPDEAYLKRIMYDIPNKNRPVEELLNSDIWTMSKPERKRLANSWRPGIREPLMNELTQALEAAKEAIAQKLTFSKEIRRDILSQTSVIGMTTSGAAGRHELISAIAPKIIICEEAGEVVESHLLATLSSSTQHLIMIGDHLQLRPQIQTHNLSSESRIGRHHNLNISLFERLAQEEMGLLQLPLSRLTVQRRMRPEISSLIRIPSLYPYLEDGDGDNVHYDNVSGMSENLYFMDHSNPVDSKDQFGPQSFSNTFEVRMVGALVEYLMNNGYNRPGDIAVLTPYLGQHKKLQSSLDHIRLVMDENEQDQLNNQGADKEPLDDRLTVRTIDNFQGEEAKVVIISLVRNAKKSDGSAAPSGTIGFLKSSNRTNVLLSRAKHGMFLIGNASLMEKEGNGIWPEVIDKLRQSNRVGDGYPVACMKHPEAANIVTTPEMLREVAPDGGCDRPCGYNLTCGHVCPRKCHPVDPEHKLFKCPQPCVRLRSDCDHICPKTCGEPCGDCMVVVDTIELGCGHVLEDPSCYQAKDPSSVHCRIELTMHQSSCEHEYVTECGNADNDVLCHKPCGSPLDCGHGCIRSCSECQKLTTESGFGLGNNRTTHGQCLTKCDLMQPCGHPCEFSCHVGTPCPPCKQRCLKQCAHGQCRKSCHGLCDDDICLQPCTWECPHYGRCEMPCGLPCNRPPCNKRCQKMLNCGHQCPSVCGEECPPQKFCIQCQDAETMNLNVLMYPEVKCLRDQNVDNDPVLVLTCGHAVAMSVLD
ncbi:MAG: P-loop containing nucleoside triphosphate hydrolase protein, partial [Benniella sp.]